VALSVVLLVGAGLFVRSFQALQRVDLGFEPEGLTLMEVDLPGARYPDGAAQVAFYDQLLERLRGLPGVLAVAGTSQPPGASGFMTFSFSMVGGVATNASGREDDEVLHAVSPGYFETIGQPLLAGRVFDARDRSDGPPVVILNASLARKHFPDGDAVGRRLAFRAGETPWREVVGVVADTRLESPDRPPEEGIYIPFAQKTWDWLTWTTLVVRAAPNMDPASLSSSLRATLLGVDPALPPQSIHTVASAFRSNTARRTFAMTLVAGFGILALLLSIVGLYGLITYSVARQRREIGVRMALGAAAGDVVGRVLRHSLMLTLAGAAMGVVGAAAVSGVIQTLLFGVSALDAATYVATVGLVVGVALFTAAWPAVRAARVDPGLVLRGE
jgi:predicted permease